MSGHTPNLRSRPNATYSSVMNSANNNSSDSYSAILDGTNDERNGGFSRLCCSGRSRSSNHREPSTGSYSGGFCGCYAKEESRPKSLAVFYSFTKSIIWIFFSFVFSMILMFGPAIQSLADVGPIGDEIFLYLRIIMLLFFTLDIVVRCVAEEDYFASTFCSGRRECRNHSMLSSHSITMNGDSNAPFFHVGSFLFWCDFISTLSILYDLSFINNHHFNPVSVEINLIGGILNPKMSSGYQEKRLSLNSLEVNILIVILRTARCARFVQSRAAVDVINRLNCYGMLNRLRLLKPCFCFNHWQAKHELQHRSLRLTEDVADKMNSIGGATVNGTNRKSKNPLVISVLATDHAEAEKEAREERQIFNQFGQGLRKKLNPSNLGSGEESLRRRDAAIKIQRTWRSRVRYESDDEWGLATHSNQLSVSVRQKNLDQNDAILASFAEKNSEDVPPKSRFQKKAGKAHNESQVGSEMRQLIGTRVAIGTLLILICTVLFTYTERTTTPKKVMVVLHTQTKRSNYIDRSLSAAVGSSVPTLYEYHPAVDGRIYYNPNYNGTNVTPRNIINITVIDSLDVEGTTMGLFNDSRSVKREAMVDIIATIFIIIFWFAGVKSFFGPVVMLVITPVEQMVRLLGMITLNPLGYQSTLMFKVLSRDEQAMSENTGWSREVLKGMETSFLKSTIERIGSLMKVGFGSAGVQIIQNNLETGQNQNMLILNSQGKPVSCIFLFCDIRQFTDATEQLQEEVFVFTNRIAAVVHSICNSNGGAANKNVGDAFLLTWSLDEKGMNGELGPLKAKNNQADKALLSVIKICTSLSYDYFFLEPLSHAARGRLKTKLKDRTGSVVQMGFGLHAGRAVQGAIGSQRKIDAAYVAESAERAEFLESSTKKYKLKMLMSGEFHKLLHSRARDRCRKIDQLLMPDRGDDTDEGEVMNIFTFDMDADAVQQSYTARNGVDDCLPNTGSVREIKIRRQNIRNRRKGYGQKMNLNARDRGKKNEKILTSRESASDHEISFGNKPPELVLPNGPVLYSQNVWLSPDMKIIRQKYVEGQFFFEKYKLGLKAFYSQEWDDAKKHFQDVLENFDDGPSKYFLAQIDENNGIPPKGFRGYGRGD